MKHKAFLLSFVVLVMIGNAFAQDLKKFNLYKPADDAEASIAKAVKEAKATGKHVFIQIGGNWCIWCARFNDLLLKEHSLDSITSASYVTYHLNYSKENTNEKLLAKYGYPQRFGFPVFLILDGDGKLIHTQNSSYLEEGYPSKEYKKEAVLGFFKDWSTAAFDPAQYKEQ
jgi:thioredoxin-related protein